MLDRPREYQVVPLIALIDSNSQTSWDAVKWDRFISGIRFEFNLFSMEGFAWSFPDMYAESPESVGVIIHCNRILSVLIRIESKRCTSSGP
ncbi:uncharacterized protein Nmag_0646 [Natrialba magadii ATCC 43099]|uniref:Uncharacterized protein n=1 Tax=Natrialba magadii (strain ATCC 43099 / DSM 3394 / CCM 3739 / CIP 104546 / IAM 13178 / JCM 8861 / NBRC 102185 / NCIMB 2190 / MS3) TaxID=547559 RepID=D3SZ97_NATMM|nr:uncharacterized protein Nmag_0646 [Natrialba magadii ATCC 43099]